MTHPTPDASQGTRPGGGKESREIPTPLRIAISGASGDVGSRLVPFLREAGHRVQVLVRRSPRPGSSEIPWNPVRGELDSARLEGIDAMIHLGGASVAAERWTALRKRILRDSRVQSTALLARTLTALKQPPSVFVTASAVGFYGDRGDEVLTEQSPAGTGFLADLCREWEAAAEPAAQAGIRVVNLRTGIVLMAGHGVLGKLGPMFRFGVGGVLGSGQQWMSCIAREDLIGAIRFLLTADTVRGPVNGVGPEPVTNRRFSETLGKVLHRPSLLPAPEFALKLAMGEEMARELILSGQRVFPRRLQEAGYRFQYETFEGALRGELSRREEKHG